MDQTSEVQTKVFPRLLLSAGEGPLDRFRHRDQGCQDSTSWKSGMST